jgi:hypothetical protein
MNSKKKLLCALALVLPWFAALPSQARVHLTNAWQNLPLPENPDPGYYFMHATDVAIDGDSIVATFRFAEFQSGCA